MIWPASLLSPLTIHSGFISLGQAMYSRQSDHPFLRKVADLLKIESRYTMGHHLREVQGAIFLE